MRLVHGCFMLAVSALFLFSCTPELTIVAGGDIGLARNVAKLIAREGDGSLFDPIRPLLEGSLSLANFEGALSDRPETPWAGPKDPNLVLVSPQSQARALRGWSALSTANNHSLDAGLSGWADTKMALEDAGVRPLNGLSLVPAGRWTAAVIAIAQPFPELEGPGPEPVALASDDTAEDVRRARSLTDGPVIVFVHWGDENSPYVSERQRRWGRAWIDAGADLVLGAHPHLWQSIELRGRGLIAYSLGNLAFDSAGGDARQTGLLRVRWSRDHGVIGYEVIPLRLVGPARRPVPIDKLEQYTKD